MKQYLDLVQHVMEKRLSKGDRTGTGTKAYSDIRCVLTCRMVLWLLQKNYLKSIIYELFVPKGDTNIKYLQENGVKIGMLGLMPMAI
jgi:thymidylate synthase